MLRLGIALAAAFILPLQAAELRVTCYSDGNECDVLRELATQFTAAHKATTIKVDQVAYKAILESLGNYALGKHTELGRIRISQGGGTNDNKPRRQAFNRRGN